MMRYGQLVPRGAWHELESEADDFVHAMPIRPVCHDSSQSTLDGRVLWFDLSKNLPGPLCKRCQRIDEAWALEVAGG